VSPLIPPGTYFEKFLDSIYVGQPLKIIETGCMRNLATISEMSDGWSTLYISRWVKKHPTCKFESVDLDINAIELAHMALEAEGLAKFCTFLRKDSILYLSKLTWVDFAFLDSCDGLQHGLDEFRLAASAGAKMIVGDDYQTKFAWSVKAAKEMGWSYEQVDRYSVLRRP
jgi:hypothetical protein